jgi:PAS domain S-box-containing protein
MSDSPDLPERRTAQRRRTDRRATDLSSISIAEGITDEVNAFDREWRFTYVNELALNSIRKAKGEKLTRQEVLGKNVWEMFPQLVGSLFYQKYHEAMREQRAVEFEARSTVTDRWVKVNAIPSEGGLSVYYRDITERKRAEDTLKKQNEVLRTIVDNIPVMIRFLGPDARVQLINPAWERTLGWSLDEVEQRNLDLFQDLYPDPQERQRALEFVAAATGEWADFRIRARDG